MAGKGNTNANALSHNPVDDTQSSDSPGDSEIAAKQEADPHFQVMIAYYIKDGSLPAEDEHVVLEQPHFDLIDDIFCHENPSFPGHWCTGVTKELRESDVRCSQWQI